MRHTFVGIGAVSVSVPVFVPVIVQGLGLMGRRSAKRSARKPPGVGVGVNGGGSGVLRTPQLVGAAIAVCAALAGAGLMGVRFGGSGDGVSTAAGDSRDTSWAPVFGASVVGSVRHHEDAFTQGLVWTSGSLWESTGLLGSSRVRRIDTDTDGAVISETWNDKTHFGEGLARWPGGRLVQLTWRNGLAHVWDVSATPRIVSTFPLPGERWGIAESSTSTTGGSSESEYFVSDGTSEVVVLRHANSDTGRDTKLNPEPVRRLTIRDGGHRVYLINELEFVNGVLWANVWFSPLIARIDAVTGRVLSWVDCSALAPERYASKGHRVDVFNGIAYDKSSGRIFVTGKLWPRIFEIQVNEEQPLSADVRNMNPFFMNETIVDEIMRSTGKT